MPDLAKAQGRVAVIGGGLSGMMTALELAPRPVVLITRAGLGQQSSSLWAQGGIAAALGTDDSTDLHLADTLAAGAGLCDATASAGILADTSAAITALERYGVTFDRGGDGSYVFGREAAHSRRRILHVGGDGAGAAITMALAKAVEECPSILQLTDVEARRLIVQDGSVSGVLLQRGGRAEVLPCTQVVMATGGVGGLFDATTNPIGNYGQGVMMAARAGAQLMDMEFVQFHPTALDIPCTPLGLVSEAVRGEGAILIDERGERFMADVPGQELAPRDVVARAIYAVITRGGRVFLDAREAIGDRFASAFAGVNQICHEAGIDPAQDLIPVRPAAHYHMGGIATDAFARSSLPGLWAVGECAATGLHGANRLASNSLLEAAVMAQRAARDLKGQGASEAIPFSVAVQSVTADPSLVRPIVSPHLGDIRDVAGLRQAIVELLPLAQGSGPAADPAVVALSMAVFASLRAESRGGHCRADYPNELPNSASRRMGLSDVFAVAEQLINEPICRSA